VNVEQAGKPTVHVVTQRFVNLAATVAETTGWDGLRSVVVQHPFNELANDTIVSIAGRVVDDIANQLAGR
jgi:hypothetical protein